MEIIKNTALMVINTYKANIVLNTVIIVLILVLGFFAIKISKIKLSVLAEMIKVQLLNLTGPEKFEKIVNWFLNSYICKDTILKYVPEKWIRKFLQWIYNTYKGLIKAK